MLLPSHPVLAANDRTAVVQALRERLAGTAGGGQAGPLMYFGVPALDRRLPRGGLALDALHEIVPAHAGMMPVAFGFMVALMGRIASVVPFPAPAVLVIAANTGLGALPYGHGLMELGLDPGRLMLVEAHDDAEALWALEEALRVGEPAVVAGLCGRGLDLTMSRRLQLAAGEARRTLLLLRPAEALAASAAATRWRIGPAPGRRDEFGLLSGWCWHVALERCRNGQTGEWILEWDHDTYCFGVAAALAGAAFPDGAEAPARVA